ncbi:hypothetical protein GCM10025883_18840 [Mobilicoccus caccae]|uniref:Uncharacterized protein n=1 Tax=Mobilicoccus caccae TaxID=1859295 RepID=A0ABQ6ISY2_9MICO|nr:hypothetical protein GCM10025883_18840 [Mobilicoccus caccae]
MAPGRTGELASVIDAADAAVDPVRVGSPSFFFRPNTSLTLSVTTPLDSNRSLGWCDD